MRKHPLIYSLLLFLFGLLFSVFPHMVYADPGGLNPFLAINGSYELLYPISISSLPYTTFPVPLYSAHDNYLINQPLTFSLDTNLMPVSKEDLPNAQFEWDFGDGTKGEGLQNTHTYTKMGSYIMTIRIKNAPHYVPLTSADQSIPFNAVLIAILPYPSYQLPQAVIQLNQQTLPDPLTNSLTFDFTKGWLFDASVSKQGSAPLVSYFWDFGDQTSSTEATVHHTLKPNDQIVSQTFPVLRVVDANGFISDTYVTVNNTAYSPRGLLFKRAVKSANQQQNNQNVLVTLSTRFNDFLKRLTVQIFANNKIDLVLLGVVVFFAFFAGSLHALTPGHGKSMMAAFLIGRGKSRIFDVLILAASITFAHTFVIYLLGFTLLFLTNHLVVNRILPYFDKASAIAVAILALSLIYKGWKNYKHAWDHAHDHEHSHSHHHHDDNNKHHYLGNRILELIFAGVSGGLTPCIDALALLLLAVSINQIGFGLFIIFIFSLGLSGCIILLGTLVVLGKNTLQLEKRFGNTADIYGPLLAGIFILFLSINIFLTK